MDHSVADGQPLNSCCSPRGATPGSCSASQGRVQAARGTNDSARRRGGHCKEQGKACCGVWKERHARVVHSASMEDPTLMTTPFWVRGLQRYKKARGRRITAQSCERAASGGAALGRKRARNIDSRAGPIGGLCESARALGALSVAVAP